MTNTVVNDLKWPRGFNGSQLNFKLQINQTFKSIYPIKIIKFSNLHQKSKQINLNLFFVIVNKTFFCFSFIKLSI